MEREFDTLREQSLKASLNNSERQSLRASLMSYIDSNPVSENMTVREKNEKSFGSVTDFFNN